MSDFESNPQTELAKLNTMLDYMHKRHLSPPIGLQTAPLFEAYPDTFEKIERTPRQHFQQLFGHYPVRKLLARSSEYAEVSRMAIIVEADKKLYGVHGDPEKFDAIGQMVTNDFGYNYFSRVSLSQTRTIIH